LYGKLMSRIGNKPIDIPPGVKIEQKGQFISVEGPLGQMKVDSLPGIKVEVDSNQKKVLVGNDHPEDRQNRQLHGTTRALLANMVIGVSKGFEKKMEIFGTGYNVKEQGGKLIFQVGYSQPVERVIPKGVKITINVGATRGNDVPAKFTLVSIDKALLGQFAADIRKIKPPEPYKGKGIRYADEKIRRKVGKAFASGGA
jgi:large subunit ribosomal protein L6